MANFEPFIKKHRRISFKTIYHDFFDKKDPDDFKPNGSQIFHGYQGEGKSLSMYHAMVKLKAKYPKTVLVSNLALRDYKPVKANNVVDLENKIKTLDFTKEYLFYETYTELILLLKHARNGDKGVIFMIDEIHNYFHSHDSKSMPMWVVQVFSQQRKQRLVILGTVQDWEDLIKAIRKQVDNLIACQRLGYLIRQTAIDPRTFEFRFGERVAPIRKHGYFFITKKLREGTDTYLVINSGREIIGGNDLSVNVSTSEDKKTRPTFGRKQFRQRG